MLKFSKANAKIVALSQDSELSQYIKGRRKVYSFDLLSGWSCPFANECLSKVVIQDGSRKIRDGVNTEFRCFSASQEVVYTNVYNVRKHNFDTLRALDHDGMYNALSSALPKDAGIVRIHVAGDMFSQSYFDAWVSLAKHNSNILFYAYTKSLKFWVNRLNDIPQNLVLTASFGGRLDNLISEHGLRYSKVVYHPSEAENLGLEIDHDDSHAAKPSAKNISFALLVHGVQPKESEAAKALQILKRDDIKHSYNRKRETASV